jgi:CheY-like chemotaxis protein
MARILLVEDEEIQRRTVEAMLKSAGHQVFLASNGAQALVLAQDKKPEVILSDLGMPTMDGKTLVERVRHTQGLEGTYIIAVTALEGEVPRLEVMLAGADDFVRKPVQKEDLIHRIEIGVTIRGLRRELAEAKSGGSKVQETQDALAGALDAALQGIEDGVARLNAGDPSGAHALLTEAHAKVRRALERLS